MNTQFKKGILDIVVLYSLRKKDKYGYELCDNISKVLDVTTATLYLLLKRRKQEEYVETYLVESDSGPARKYYHLTDKGNDYLSVQLKEWNEFKMAVDELLGEND